MSDGVDSKRAWLVVVATFLSSFVTLGLAYSFGAFFTEMAEEFDANRAATSVMFGLTTFAFFWLSLITGRLADRYGPRIVLLFGAGFLLVGLLATSRAQSLTLGYLTYGIGVGVAAATGYIPMVAAVGGWFERHRATAVGLAVAGIGAGTLVMSPTSAALIERYGWRDTFVIYAIVGPAVMVVAAMFVASPPGHVIGQPSRSREALGSPVFRRLQISALCSGLALFVPFVFVGQYASERGVGSVAAAVLIGLLGGASVLARIGFGSAVRRFGSVRLYRACFALLGTSFLLWLVAGSSYGVLVAFVLVLGIGYGGFVALSTIVVAERFGVAGLGSILGVFYTTQGLGGLVGPPVAGAAIDAFDAYWPVIVVCGLLEAAAFMLIRRLPVQSDGSLAPEGAVG